MEDATEFRLLLAGHTWSPLGCFYQDADKISPLWKAYSGTSGEDKREAQ